MQRSVESPGRRGAARIDSAMEMLGRRRPARLAGVEVTAVTDYRRGAEERPRWLPAAPLVILELGGAGRALVRPSGTEPKLKIYVDRRVALAPGDDVRPAEDAASAEARAMADELVAFLGLE